MLGERDIFSVAAFFKEYFSQLQGWLLEDLRKRDQTFSVKTGGELVSRLDKKIELTIIDFLTKYFPALPVVSEEIESAWPPAEETFWLIDPLDGTHHLLMGRPTFGVMIALIENQEVKFSAVFLPAEELIWKTGFYFAGAKGGAWRYKGEKLNSLEPSRNNDLKNSTILLEGKSINPSRAKINSKIITEAGRIHSSLTSSWAGTRVAAGGLLPLGADSLISIDNKPWDNIPIAFLVQEAGGLVTDFKNEPWSLKNCSNLIFSNGKRIHEKILEILR